jgi:MFS superfamily sulfate permease-like transporter
VLLEVMAGIIIGVVLSLVLLLQRLSTPNVAVLGRHPDRGIVAIDANPGTKPVPHAVILRPDGPLVFASIDPVIGELRSRTLGADEVPRLVVLDLSSTSEIDVTAATALAGVVAELRTAGIEVRFAGAHASVRDYARRLGGNELTSLADPYPSVAAAVGNEEG